MKTRVNTDRNLSTTNCQVLPQSSHQSSQQSYSSYHPIITTSIQRNHPVFSCCVAFWSVDY